MTEAFWARRRGWAEAALLALIALAVRLPHLEVATPWYDDFYHLLAARSWLVDGTLGIVEGEYTRAALFTRLVAESLRLFGDSFIAGRLPALVAGTLWVVAVFAWFRHLAGPVAGWTAGLLFALDPGAVALSQWVRFYTLHGLMVWLGAICFYHLITSKLDRRRSTLLGVGAVASFSVALHLQTTTVLAVGAAGLWAAAIILRGLPAWLADGPHAERRRWVAAAAALALLGVGAWFAGSGRVAALWARYTTPFFWMEGSTEDDPRWFFWWFAIRYPTLWTLLPVAMAVAVARFVRPALFSLVMFFVPFVAVSFGPAPQERYLYFALPFFFGLWALALATLLPAFQKIVERTVAAMTPWAWPPAVQRRAASALVALGLLFVASQNEAPRLTTRLVFPGSGERPYREADWSMVLPELRALTDSADVVLSSYVLKPLYYFGRGDFHLSWTETAEAGFADGEPIEFSRDPRTGLPGISSPESVAAVMECYESGLILTERFHLNRAHLVPEATTKFIVERIEEVPMPPESWVVAYRWRHEAVRSARDCSFAAGPVVRSDGS